MDGTIRSIDPVSRTGSIATAAGEIFAFDFGDIDRGEEPVLEQVCVFANRNGRAVDIGLLDDRGPGFGGRPFAG